MEDRKGESFRSLLSIDAMNQQLRDSVSRFGEARFSNLKCAGVFMKHCPPGWGHLARNSNISAILRFGPGDTRSTSAGKRVHRAAIASVNSARDCHGPAPACAPATARALPMGMLLLRGSISL